MDKPNHLDRSVGDQFADKSIVENYKYRPAYTSAAIDFLSDCLGMDQMDILDIGSGTGEVSIPLADKGHRVIGVDPSLEMVKTATAKNSSVEFVRSYLEDFTTDTHFDLFVAANSIHWLDWSVTFPLLKSMARKHSRLAIVTGGDLVVDDIQKDLVGLIKQFSSTRNFKAYSIVDMLSEQGYIGNVNEQVMPVATVEQSLNDYIASFHARNGFSLDRMGSDNARLFDQALMQTLIRSGYSENVVGTVHFKITLADILLPER